MNILKRIKKKYQLYKKKQQALNIKTKMDMISEEELRTIMKKIVSDADKKDTELLIRKKDNFIIVPRNPWVH